MKQTSKWKEKLLCKWTGNSWANRSMNRNYFNSVLLDFIQKKFRLYQQQKKYEIQFLLQFYSIISNG